MMKIVEKPVATRILNRTSFQKLLADLEAAQEAKEEALGNEQDKDSPNDERVEKLEEEIRILEELTELVQEYIDLG